MIPRKMRKALDVADSLGIPYDTDYRRIVAGPLWNGRRLDVSGMTPEDIIHECAHWVVASPNRRQLPNYGLGVDYTGGYGRMVVAETSAQKEEEIVCVVDCAMLRTLRWPWLQQARTYDWFESSFRSSRTNNESFPQTWEGFKQAGATAYTTAIKRRFITQEGYPLFGIWRK